MNGELNKSVPRFEPVIIGSGGPYGPPNQSEEIHFKIADVGLGRLLTTGTQVLLQLSVEETKYDQLRVLEQVIEKLGIDPEDFNRIRRNDQKARKLEYDNHEKMSWE